MINKIEQFLLKNNLTTPQSTLVVGFSGGYDSCALLHMLSILREKYQFKLCAAHLNHNWRKEAANQDEQNCKNFCEKENIELFAKKLPDSVPKTETAAREARYNFFAEAAKYFQTNIILTAHTKSDNAETVIYRIAKGTGIRGLCAIDSIQNIKGLNIYRPLLDITREQIEAYCKENKLSPNNDLSNLDTKYKRNFVRHKILPLLKEINPKAETAINSLSELAKAQEEIINEYLGKIRADIIQGDKYNTNLFISCSPAIQQRIIYDLVLDENLDYDKKKITEILDFIHANKDSKSGRTHTLGTDLWLFCNNEFFYKITDLHAEIETTSVQITDINKSYQFGNMVLTIEKAEEIPKIFPKETENIAIVDISNEPNLELRYRKNGDIIQPFGMSKPIKLKKFFINKGVAQHKKNKIVLLCNSNEVLWALGVGVSEKLRVKSAPVYILRIEEV